MTDAPLSSSLALARSLLDRARPHAGLGAAFSNGSPFIIDLPDYHGGLGARIDTNALRTLASLYFNAEIEGTYLLAVAEELAGARFTLNLDDVDAARRLEEFAAAMRREWVDRTLRNQIFARVFGVGYPDANLGEGIVNHAFEPNFARLCQAFVQAAIGPPYQSSSSGTTAILSMSFSALSGVLAPKLQGNTLIVAERLTTQLQLAVDTLNAPGLARLFMGRTAWDVVRGVLGQDLPNLSGHVTRAQTGMRIMAWLAEAAPALHSGDSATISARIAAQPQVGDWAALWLDASGLSQQAQPTQSGYAQAPYGSGHGALQSPYYGASGAPSAAGYAP
ncbi:hypothetical protein [Celeribacter arenosi]|uniref:Uncharacterized protein n=1 Tax=Celeribacter arenosi TaxID=792649 RepID=A0ABP7KGG0_9RHOB